MMTPTGLGIRNDAGGAGYYGARRTKEAAGRKIEYAHRGTDYQCRPGQVIKMPCTGKIVRHARPYVGDSEYDGVMIEAKRLVMKIFYIELYDGIVGKIVKMGEPIGIAQDVSKRYPGSGVTPHVHVQIEQCDPEFFLRD
jgi:hypothetical protein